MGKKISIPAIEEEMHELLEKGWMCRDDLKMLVLLGDAMQYLAHTDREFTEADAKNWVAHMNPPARWSMEQTTAVMRQRGYDHKPCVFWAVMNAMASDYGKTMAKYGADKPEVWADLADDFIEDADAVDGKVGRYWRDIVRH